jgi:hypothetical protein
MIHIKPINQEFPSYGTPLKYSIKYHQQTPLYRIEIYSNYRSNLRYVEINRCLCTKIYSNKSQGPFSDFMQSHLESYF